MSSQAASCVMWISFCIGVCLWSEALSRGKSWNEPVPLFYVCGIFSGSLLESPGVSFSRLVISLCCLSQ